MTYSGHVEKKKQNKNEKESLARIYRHLNIFVSFNIGVIIIMPVLWVIISVQFALVQRHFLFPF